MLRFLLFYLIVLFWVTNVQAQTDWSPVLAKIGNEVTTLSKNQIRDINRFSRIAHRQHPELSLKNKNIKAIPIYSVYADNKFRNTTKVKDSLLFYFNYKKLYINEVHYFKDSVYYMTVLSRYSNFHGQMVGHFAIDVPFSLRIELDNPELIFCLSGSNFIYFFLKDNKLYPAIYFCGKKVQYEKITINEYINSCLDDIDLSLLTMSSKPVPSIYVK